MLSCPHVTRPALKQKFREALARIGTGRSGGDETAQLLVHDADDEPTWPTQITQETHGKPAPLIQWCAKADGLLCHSPWVILSDFGSAFAMGAVGGTIWHGIKGARNSPRGDRLVGALSVVKARAPVTGGNFGVWGGMFSTFDCAVKGWRQKEDMWNAIISGFLTGGCLAARSEYLLPPFTDGCAVRGSPLLSLR
ncbi:Mitochondrial import inner membrane translocase subunit tim17 [Trametes pubescens]|uniref:Mitochondrial import inner membrane translocase subunit tim17 n=1 Tax=Trametes pubescens TaxID=154538 RepID=A0A1M2VHD9_TRAPU|nr:Mitochondrial import inner membrane translocase subunit tim17 [Trametes pubescens]